MMNDTDRTRILNLLDQERRTIVYPGMTRITEPGIVKDLSDDGTSAEIVYSSSTEVEIDAVIARQVQATRDAPYALEWKLYEHDQPSTLGEHLTAAGFEADDREAFLVLQATPESLSRFGTSTGDIRRVTDRAGLRDMQTIMEEVRGTSCASQIEQYIFLLENHPTNMSLYVAYADGEPAACGRVYFHANSQFAALYGGQTRERFRKQGLFTQVVAARIREALHRGVTNICVDALPTSEPILRKRGFEIVTYTQPFCLSG